MKKLYGKRIDIGVYNWYTTVLYGNPELLNVWAKKQYKGYDDTIKKTVHAFCYRDNPDENIVPDFIYIGKTKNDYTFITHEALHFALFLLANCNVLINAKRPEGHEALTYLTGYLVGEITKNNWYEYKPNNKKKKWV